MTWSTKLAIDHCLSNLGWELIHPQGVRTIDGIPSKTKTVVFRVPNSLLQVAMPLNRKGVVSCYVPHSSVGMTPFPSDRPESIHTGISVRERYPREDGKRIANTLLRHAPSLEPARRPYMLGVETPDAFVALMNWVASASVAEPLAMAGGSAGGGSTGPSSGPSEDGEVSEAGIEPDPIIRRAVELYAERLATLYFEGRGYSVKKLGKPFDLLCESRGSVLHVEVKGSRNRVDAVTLTANEVADARSPRWQSALFVVDEIVVRGAPGIDLECSGGRRRVIEGWAPSETDLEPSEFRYRLPTMRVLADD